MMIPIMAITLVLVGASLVFRNLMPDREEYPMPGAWDGNGRMSRRRRAFRFLTWIRGASTPRPLVLEQPESTGYATRLAPVLVPSCS
jgi:hypothetical protein